MSEKSKKVWKILSIINQVLKAIVEVFKKSKTPDTDKGKQNV